MAPLTVCDSVGTDSYVENILNIPERPELERLATLTGHLFHVPVAYLELVDHTSEVVTRIGPGSELGTLLKIYPRSFLSERAMVVRDASLERQAGDFGGGLRFLASAPLVTSSGISLGALVIADFEPRPVFGDRDAAALGELAGVVASKMEFRLIAAHVHESELALRETEQRFRAIADSAPVLIICSAADGASTFVNQTWLDFTGRTLEEELADAGAGCVHPDSRKIVYQTYWRALEARQPVTIEFPMRRYDGEYRWMLCRGVPRFLDGGAFAGFVATMVDITNHYKGIAEIQKHALCASAAANAGGLFYLMLDPYGRIEQTNAIADAVDPRLNTGMLFWETEIAARHGPQVLQAAVEEAAVRHEPVRIHTTKGGEDGLCWTIAPIVSACDQLIALVATAGKPARTAET